MMIGSTRISRKPAVGPALLDIDGDGQRFAVTVDGVITYAGLREECERRLAIHAQGNTRHAQDQRLGRVLAG